MNVRFSVAVYQHDFKQMEFIIGICVNTHPSLPASSLNNSVPEPWSFLYASHLRTHQQWLHYFFWNNSCTFAIKT